MGFEIVLNGIAITTHFDEEDGGSGYGFFKDLLEVILDEFGKPLDVLKWLRRSLNHFLDGCIVIARVLLINMNFGNFDQVYTFVLSLSASRKGLGALLNL